MTPLAMADPIGQAHDIKGKRLSEAFAEWRGLSIIHGPSVQPAPIDSLLYRGNALVAVLESRTRKTHSHEDIQSMGDTYLITHQKLLDLLEGGRLFGVPSYLVIQMACGTRWAWEIGDCKGTPNFSWEVKWTETRATSLDGTTTMRDNAYIPMRHGRKW